MRFPWRLFFYFPKRGTDQVELSLWATFVAAMVTAALWTLWQASHVWQPSDLVFGFS